MNHQSSLDIVVAFMVLPVNLRFVAKHVLKYVPFLGWYMWATGMIFVHRGRRGAAMGSLVEAAARVRDGASVLVFPEGTRSRDGNVQAFKKGAFVLASQAGVPIVPVAIEGSGRCFPPDGFGFAQVSSASSWASPSRRTARSRTTSRTWCGGRARPSST